MSVSVSVAVEVDVEVVAFATEIVRALDDGPAATSTNTAPNGSSAATDLAGKIADALAYTDIATRPWSSPSSSP